MANPKSYQTGKHLEAFILLLIAREPLHGGAVISHLKSLLPSNWTVDDGHVYRLLRRLESDTALVSTWITEDAGAPVRVYRVTDQGRLLLDQWKEDITLRVQSLQIFLDLWSKSQSEANPRDPDPSPPAFIPKN